MYLLSPFQLRAYYSGPTDFVPMCLSLSLREFDTIPREIFDKDPPVFDSHLPPGTPTVCDII